jgi:glucose/arabinose dehydrogenase
MVLSALLTGAQPAQQPSASNDGQDSLPLAHYEIRPEGLPPPFATPSTYTSVGIVPHLPNVKFHLPPGFEISVFAEGDLKEPRKMAQAPNGDVFVSEMWSGRIIILRDADGDGKAERPLIYTTGLIHPFGMAFWKDYFYVGTGSAIVRFKYTPGQTKPADPPEKLVEVPSGGHSTRDIILSPDGSKMYVGVGSLTNVDVERDPRRAAIVEFNPDGTGQRIYAGGLRNPIGLAFCPGTRRLWTVVQERDMLGDDLVPDYATSVKEGAFYGWPYAYIGPNEDPRRKGERPDLVKQAVVPDVPMQAHSGVVGLAFYNGKMFPKQYQGDAFVAMHGSMNRSKPTGYKVVRIDFKNNNPVGGYDDFVTGWLVDQNRRVGTGRPAGLLILKDGSMLIADDAGSRIWRVTYRAAKK